jgi:hypothetical protein
MKLYTLHELVRVADSPALAAHVGSYTVETPVEYGACDKKFAEKSLLVPHSLNIYLSIVMHVIRHLLKSLILLVKVKYTIEMPAIRHLLKSPSFSVMS